MSAELAARGAGEAFADLVAVMDRLRRECAWKRGQTHRSLVRFLVEESHEVVEAVETGTAEDLREELGDLLLQVVFHARIAEESPTPFDVVEVADGITDKLRRRNPHVFGVDEATSQAAGLDPIDRDDAEAVNARWEQVKAAEKPRDSVLDGIAPTLPALATAQKVVERLERTGRATDPSPAATGQPGDAAAEVGEQLWALVRRAHAEGVDPEQALRDVVRRVVADADPPHTPA